MMRCCFALPGVAALALLLGCGGGFDPAEGVIVHGTIVQNGQPIPAPDGVAVELIGTQIRTNAICDEKGAFEFPDAGKGVPPGKYKLTVAVFPTSGAGVPPGGARPPGTSGPPGMGPPGSAAAGDKLEGKFSEQNTKIEVDVPESKLGGKHDVGTIDVAK